MSPSSPHSSSHKKSAPKSSTHHVTETATTEASATAAAPAAPPTGNAPPASISLLAAQAKEQLDAIEAALGLDIVVRPNDKYQVRSLARVSPTALRLAADIVASAPARFPDFTGIAEGATYVETMTPLANRASELALHLQKSIANNHVPAAQQTLVLYSVVKSLGRIVDNETMREKVRLLRAEVAPKRKNAPPKQTKEQKSVKTAAKGRAKRAAKALARLQANSGPLVVQVPSAPAPTAAAPTTVPEVPQRRHRRRRSRRARHPLARRSTRDERAQPSLEEPPLHRISRPLERSLQVPRRGFVSPGP